MESQDLGSIALLEHVNIKIADQGITSVFLCEGLGLTRDPFMHVGSRNMWCNIGYQQIHLPTDYDTSQKYHEQLVCGTVGLIVPSLTPILQNLESVRARLAHTRFLWELVEEPNHPYISNSTKHLEVTSPGGNKFSIFENSPTIDFRGGLGISYVELFCHHDRAVKIASFYKHYFGAHYALEVHGNTTCAKIVVGPNQALIFRESDPENVIPYSGYHVCVYVSDFSTIFNKFKADNLLFWYETNVCDTMEEALRQRQFRTLRIVDPNQQGQKDDLFLMEHEVRSMYHHSFMRTLVNASGKVGIYCNQ